MRRYKGGKRPLKYFKEDCWPGVEDMFTKLGFTEETGFILFRMFSDIDVDESGGCDLDECFGYLGGSRSKFNERIFEVKGAGNPEDGLEFLPFSIALWSFCTMTSIQVGRVLWEIFDLSQSGELEKPDVEAMFMMVYDLDHTEAKIIEAFPFEPKSGKISRLGYMNTLERDKRLIKPALNFQKRVRKKLGGIPLWDLLTTYRKRFFGLYDSNSATMDIALAQIVAATNPHKRVDAADVRFQQEKARLRRELADSEKELRAKQRREAAEARRAELLAEDRPMKMAWNTLDGCVEAFANTVFSIGDEWERQEERSKLYALYDNAVYESAKYWSARDAKERDTMYSTDADKSARLADYLESEEGVHERTALLLEAAFELLTERYPGHDRMSGIETARLSAIADAQESLSHVLRCRRKQQAEANRLADNYARIIEEKVEVDRKVDPDLEMVVHEQPLAGFMKVAKKYLGRKDMPQLEKDTDQKLQDRLHADAVQELEWNIARSTEERRRTAVIKQFNISTQYGSRNTKWELVFDPDQMRNVFVNTETHEVAHEKTAICHECDTVLAQADLRCQECDNPRSAKNLKLYRPLGFKELIPD